ncbi:MAG TPA: RDD family protein [Janthinobacterium sp.]|nr:RDD family protein [Janthinobacterium sp.]
MSNSTPGTPTYSTPTIRRRLIGIIYEAFLLIAVEALVLVIFMLVTGNRQTPGYEHGRQFTLFLATAAYFIHFWTDSGHTLAMKTWRIKLVKPGYARLPIKVATARFMLAWGWFLPALLVCYVFKLTSKTEVGVAIAVGMAAWACTALFDKDRQFLHDKLVGTRLISLPKPVKKSKLAAAV